MCELSLLDFDIAIHLMFVCVYRHLLFYLFAPKIQWLAKL